MRPKKVPLERRLADEIVVASKIAKSCLSLRGSELAYSVKARKLSRGLEIFPGEFTVVSLEFRRKLGLLALFRLPNNRQVHCPLSHLSPIAQARVLNVVNSWVGDFEAASKAASSFIAA